MSFSMYPKLAWSGMWKNKKLYIPYILTSVGMVAMYYIVTSIAYSDGIMEISGGGTIVDILNFGSGIMAVFSAIFLFYTSSFLMRRRQREFGLYNILGMGKRHISIIMLIETAITAAISLVFGFLFGITFSKLAEAGIHHIMKVKVGYELTVSFEAMLSAIPIFSVIFTVILISTLLRVRLSNPVALLHSESTGERPPKGNPIIAVIGAILLGVAYYIAVTTQNPIMALALFFAAVIMVIIGTYALFISGSVVLCRILKKNKRYYYRSDHFISVSSMAFRMKRNGAGLASICILLTMVLVMLTASFSLYSSEEDMVNKAYPRSIMCQSGIWGFEQLNNDETMEAYRKAVEKNLKDAGVNPENEFFFRMTYTVVTRMDGVYYSYNDTEAGVNVDDYYYAGNTSNLYIIPLRDYNRMYGTDYTLADDEVLLYTVNCDYTDDTINIGHIGEYKIVGNVDEMLDADRIMISAFSTIMVIMNDVGENLEPLDSFMSRQYYYGFDVAEDMEISARDAIYNIELNDEDGNAIYPGVASISISSRERDRADFYSMFGGIFFLGVMLSIVFMLAAVLIIYYKQISEGYEDRDRFEIMQKVGLTKKDIKRSINSQMRTVFVLPIAMAAVHLAFAFPMLRRMLQMFNFSNRPLLLLTASLCVLIFTAIYMIVYKLTAGAYYHIVSGGER